MTDHSEVRRDEDAGRPLPNGDVVNEALWLRVRARILDVLDGPELIDGKLADIADAACLGFVEFAPSFKGEFSCWYARRVVQLMDEETPAALIRSALDDLGEDGYKPTETELDSAAMLLQRALEVLGDD